MVKTQKSTKVTEEERIDALGEMKSQIRSVDPNLSETEIEARAIRAVGLDSGISGKEADRRMSEPRKSSQALSQVGKAATSSGARRVIFGVMVLAIAVGWIRDIQKGRQGVTDAMPRRIVGAFLAGFMLMILAGPMPKVAKGLAVLVGFSAVAFNVETVEWISGGVTKEAQTRSLSEVLGAPGRDPGSKINVKPGALDNLGPG